MSNIKETLKTKIADDVKKMLAENEVQSSNAVKNWKMILESDKFPKIKREDFGTLAMMLENQEKEADNEISKLTDGAITKAKMINESNISDMTSIQPYLKILVPIIRRSYRSMTAMDLVGVQNLSAPQGYIFALRFYYAGDKDNVALMPSNLDRGANSDLNFMSYATAFRFRSGGTFADIKYASTDTTYTYIVKTTTNTTIQASGTITFTGTPVADETFVIGAQTFTFKAARSAAGEVTISANNTTQAANVVTAVTADIPLVATATNNLGVVTVTAVAIGAAGNTVILTEAATGTAVSGAGTLAGGVNGVAGSDLTGKTLAQVEALPGTIVVGKLFYGESGKVSVTDDSNVLTDDVAKIGVNRYTTGGGVVSDIPVIWEYSGSTPYTNYWIVNFDTQATPVVSTKKAIDEFLQVVKNEIGFDFIFKNYSGLFTTSQGEYMGSSDAGSPKFKTVKMTLEKKMIEVKTRGMKIQYSDELYTDLKQMHGLLANEELTKMVEFELANEINAWILQKIVQSATVSTAWTYGKPGIGQQSESLSGTTADGLDMARKLETLVFKINSEATKIALTSRRGAGNVAVVTPNVYTALKNTNHFTPAAGDDVLVGGLSFAGNLGRIKIYVDTYNFYGSGDYVVVGYRGSQAFDAGIIYANYIPLMVKKIVDPSTGQDIIAFKTRSAVVDNLFGSEKYYRLFSVDLSNSILY